MMPVSGPDRTSSNGRKHNLAVLDVANLAYAFEIKESRNARPADLDNRLDAGDSRVAQDKIECHTSRNFKNRGEQNGGDPDRIRGHVCNTSIYSKHFALQCLRHWPTELRFLPIFYQNYWASEKPTASASWPRNTMCHMRPYVRHSL